MDKEKKVAVSQALLPFSQENVRKACSEYAGYSGDRKWRRTLADIWRPDCVAWKAS